MIGYTKKLSKIIFSFVLTLFFSCFIVVMRPKSNVRSISIWRPRFHMKVLYPFNLESESTRLTLTLWFDSINSSSFTFVFSSSLFVFSFSLLNEHHNNFNRIQFYRIQFIVGFFWDGSFKNFVTKTLTQLSAPLYSYSCFTGLFHRSPLSSLLSESFLRSSIYNCIFYKHGINIVRTQKSFSIVW